MCKEGWGGLGVHKHGVSRSSWKGADQPGPVVNSYDPQIGAAAQTQANLAQQEQDWTQNYYDQYVTPALKQQQDIANQSIALQTQDETRQQQLSEAELQAMQHQQDQQDQVFALQYGQAKQAADEYTQYGLPAQTDFYNMVNNYSSPAFEQQQAEGAIGDVRTAEQSSRQTMNRQMAAAGINPTSPAATSAAADMAVTSAATEAAAATRARNAAQALGIQLKGSAAQMASGNASTSLNFGSGASGAAAAGASGSANTGSVASGANSSAGAMAGSSAGIGLGSFGAANSGANVPLAGYAGAAGANGNVLNAWSGLGSTSMNQNGANQRAYMQEQQQEAAGLGNFVGSVLSQGVSSGWKFGLPI